MSTEHSYYSHMLSEAVKYQIMLPDLFHKQFPYQAFSQAASANPHVQAQSDLTGKDCGF